jgi:hypothetical protein
MENKRVERGNKWFKLLAVSAGLVATVFCTGAGCSSSSPSPSPRIYLMDRGYVAESETRQDYLRQTKIEESKSAPQIAIRF